MTKQNKVDMSRIILDTIPVKCKKCNATVFAWFATKELFEQGVLCKDCGNTEESEPCVLPPVT